MNQFDKKLLTTKFLFIFILLLLYVFVFLELFMSSLLKKIFPLLKSHGRGSRQLGVGRRGPALRGRRRLKYDRRHMAKAQKLTSLKRT